MSRYLVHRVLTTVPLLLLVPLVTFGLLHLTPGDPAAVIAGEGATSEDVAKTRASLGLDEPVWKQIMQYFGALFRGDLGTSIFSGRPVLSLIVARLEPTISIALLSELFAVLLSIPLGVIAAWKAHSWIDRSIMVFAVGGFAVPVFWLGYNFIWLFSMKLGILPVFGYSPLNRGVGPWLEHLILPCLTLGVTFAALITRMTRASTLEILREEYVRTARAKGLGESTVLVRHVLRNAALPIGTVVGLGLATLLAGVVVTETVFGIPGVGRLVIDSVIHRDYPVIQGVVLLGAEVYVLMNLTVDLLYAYFDPRIKYG